MLTLPKLQICKVISGKSCHLQGLNKHCSAHACRIQSKACYNVHGEQCMRQVSLSLSLQARVAAHKEACSVATCCLTLHDELASALYPGDDIGAPVRAPQAGRSRV